MTLVHHELCFGCGRANLFGLHLDLERQDDVREKLPSLANRMPATYRWPAEVGV